MTQVLIIDPDQTAVGPYQFLPQQYSITRVADLKTAADQVQTQLPQALLLRAGAYDLAATLNFLQTCQAKMRKTQTLTSLVFVVDQQDVITHLPGTSWGNQVGVLHRLSEAAEVAAVCQRLQLL